MAQASAEAINLALGELGYSFPEQLRWQAIKLLEDATPAYTANAGLMDLRIAIANYYSPAVSPDQICVCNGAEEAIFILLSALINRGDRVAIPDPDYSAYPSIVSMMEAETLRLPYNADLMTIDFALWDKLLAQNVRLLLLSNPRNPTGIFLTLSEMKKLIDICDKYGIILAVDEIYRELYLDELPHSFWGLYDKLFVISGLSKSHLMSGWRLGWIVSPSAFSASIIKTKQYVSTCSNWLSQKLAIFALSEIGMEIVFKVREKLRESQAMVQASFLDYPKILIPSASPYIMYYIGVDELEYCAQLAKRGVITVPGRAFGSVSKGWVRLNHAVEADLLAKALDIIHS